MCGASDRGAGRDVVPNSPQGRAAVGESGRPGGALTSSANRGRESEAPPVRGRGGGEELPQRPELLAG